MNPMQSVRDWWNSRNKKKRKAAPIAAKRQTKEAAPKSNLGGDRGVPRTQQQQLKELDRLEAEDAAKRKKKK